MRKTCDEAWSIGAGPQDGSPTIYDIEPSPDGNYFVCGNFTEFNGQPRLGIAQIQPDGKLTSWEFDYPAGFENSHRFVF